MVYVCWCFPLQFLTLGGTDEANRRFVELLLVADMDALVVRGIWAVWEWMMDVVCMWDIVCLFCWG